MTEIFDATALAIFVIFLISLIIPMVLPKKFPFKLNRENLTLLQFIKTIVDEDSGKIALNSSIDSKAHPLFAAATQFMDEILYDESSENYIKTTVPEEFCILASKNAGRSSLLFTPLSNANNTFYTTVKKRGSQASLILNISDGSAISDWDAYNSDFDKKRIAMSCATEGIMIDAVNSKMTLISLEPFLLSTMMKTMKNKKTLNISGVYLFLTIIASLILIFSVILTLAPYFPILLSISDKIRSLK